MDTLEVLSCRPSPKCIQDLGAQGCVQSLPPQDPLISEPLGPDVSGLVSLQRKGGLGMNRDCLWLGRREEGR